MAGGKHGKKPSSSGGCDSLESEKDSKQRAALSAFRSRISRAWLTREEGEQPAVDVVYRNRKKAGGAEGEQGVRRRLGRGRRRSRSGSPAGEGGGLPQDSLKEEFDRLIAEDCTALRDKWKALMLKHCMHGKLKISVDAESKVTMESESFPSEDGIVPMGSFASKTMGCRVCGQWEGSQCLCPIGFLDLD